MKKVLTLFLLASLLCLWPQSITPQEKKQEEKQDLKKEITTKVPKRAVPSYKPGGRKDPFRDLLVGQETKRPTTASGEPQISIENVTLIGIVKARGKYTAIISGGEDFPLFIKVGHKFADGFILSIDESKVVFRKTRERGIPLFRPKDIVKEIKLEELR